MTEEEKLHDFMGAVNEAKEIAAKYEALAGKLEELEALDSVDDAEAFRAIVAGMIGMQDAEGNSAVTDEADAGALMELSGYELPEDPEYGSGQTSEEIFEGAIDKALTEAGADTERLTERKNEEGLDMDGLSERIAEQKSSVELQKLTVAQMRADLGACETVTSDELRARVGAETDPEEGTLRAQYSAEMEKISEGSELMAAIAETGEKIAGTTRARFLRIWAG